MKNWEMAMWSVFKGVGVNSIKCTKCQSWIHKKGSGVKEAQCENGFCVQGLQRRENSERSKQRV